MSVPARAFAAAAAACTLAACETLNLGTAIRYRNLGPDDVVTGQARVAISLPPEAAEGAVLEVTVRLVEDGRGVLDERFDLVGSTGAVEQRALPPAAREAGATVFALDPADVPRAERALARLTRTPKDVRMVEGETAAALRLPTVGAETFCALLDTPVVVWTKPSAALGYRRLTQRFRLADLLEEETCVER